MPICKIWKMTLENNNLIVFPGQGFVGQYDSKMDWRSSRLHARFIIY